ncbi:MAG: tRNA pseudouridine(55) synthase TruB [Phormidesmis sp.]
MLSGFINLNKPATWSSHDCVARLRRLLQTQKVGHGGTLDPLAIGVLPIAVGRATRLIQYLPARKVYRAVIRFGLTTTTDDLEGEVLTEQSAAHLQLSGVEAALSQFVGTLDQKPPLYSAIQVNGKRLYDLARQGKAVDVPVRRVTIHQLVSQGWADTPSAKAASPQPELTIEIDCGPGTYIRSLARDLGRAVGTGATLAHLSRTHSNGFDLADSMTLEALEQALSEGSFMPLPAGEAVAHLRAIALPPDLALRWRMGQKLAFTEEGLANERRQLAQRSTPAEDSTPEPPVRVMDAKSGDFLGIGEIRYVPPVADSCAIAQKNLSQSNLSQMVKPEEKRMLHPILAAKMVFLPVS